MPGTSGESSTMSSTAPAQDVRAHQPCAACRMLRRGCGGNCRLAPYFPSNEVEKFASVHKVFGARNVAKMIQMVEESKREDTVKALVYEAAARLRDPVYGSAGAIFHLQKAVQELSVQLEPMRAQALELQEQRDQFLGILMNFHQQQNFVPSPLCDGNSNIFFFEDEVSGHNPVRFPLELD